MKPSQHTLWRSCSRALGDHEAKERMIWGTNEAYQWCVFMCVCARATNPRVCACASLPPSRGSLTLLFHAPALIPTLSLHIHHYRAVLGLSTVYYRVGGGAPRVGSHTRTHPHPHMHTITSHANIQPTHAHNHITCARVSLCLYFLIDSLVCSPAHSITYSLNHTCTHTHRGRKWGPASDISECCGESEIEAKLRRFDPAISMQPEKFGQRPGVVPLVTSTWHKPGV